MLGSIKDITDLVSVLYPALRFRLALIGVGLFISLDGARRIVAYH
jgi:hypothetical protein